jgi:hypothetical protein
VAVNKVLDRMEEALHTHLGCSEGQNPLENGGKIVRKTWGKPGKPWKTWGTDACSIVHYN